MKISGFEDIISIESFEYQIAVNQHERCVFVCWIKEQDIDKFTGLVDSTCNIENEGFKFQSKIVSIGVSKNITGVRLEVTAVGDTSDFDQEEHSRVFQDEQKTLTDMISVVGMAKLKHNCQQEKPIEGIVIQCQETDWAFIKRLAGLTGEFIFPGVDGFVGTGGKDSGSIEEDDIISSIYLIQSTGATMTCRLKKELQFGTVVTYKGKKLVVSSLQYLLNAGAYEYVYSLSEQTEVTPFDSGNGIQILEAVITDNDDPDKQGRVKVKFDDDCMSDNCPWLRCNSIFASKGFGLVSIPSVDDRVRVEIQAGKGTILGSLRMDAYSSEYTDCNTKYIIWDEGVFVEYKDGIFTYHNKDRKATFTKDSLIFEYGDKCKLMLSGDRAVFEHDKTKLELADGLQAVAREITLEAQNGFSATGSNVNIKGKSGVSIN